MSTSTTHTKVRSRLERLLQRLCTGLYEREDAVKLALLATVAGESIFLLGPPGVGKSLVARRLKYAFRDGKSFEYLMSKFSTPDEIFGPVSIKKLKDEDKYERKTEAYLPGAHIVFLDEIWKAGPAIQNALLTILNEKVYRNGEEEKEVRVRGIITASNELPPADKSLDPIWDRFLIRLEMGNIRKYDQFLQMITDTSDVYADDIEEEIKISLDQLEQWQSAIRNVAVPPEVLNTIQVVKAKLDAYNDQPNTPHPIRVYDRRWKKIVNLMRTSAFLNGRQSVDLMDCFLMVPCLWSRPSQKEMISGVVSEAVRRHGYSMAINLKMIRQEVEGFREDVEAEIRIPHEVSEKKLLPVEEEFYQLESKAEQFEGERIRIKDFQRLGLSEQQVINVYDARGTLVNRLKARKDSDEHSIVLHYNSRDLTYRLQTQIQTRSEIIHKEPHQVMVKFWESRHDRIESYIQAQQEKLLEEAPPQLDHLPHHLFVDKRHAKTVLANLEEVRTALQELALQLEKVRFMYLGE